MLFHSIHSRKKNKNLAIFRAEYNGCIACIDLGKMYCIFTERYYLELLYTGGNLNQQG